MKVKIINKSNNPLPEYKTKGSAGMDLRAYLPDGPINLMPMERRLIPTGLYIGLPDNFEATIRPRSGLSLKEGIVANLGTIDSDFTGELGIIIINLSNSVKTINSGDRIAQLVVSEVAKIDFEEVDQLPETDRGEGGFGHTGIK